MRKKRNPEIPRTAFSDRIGRNGKEFNARISYYVLKERSGKFVPCRREFIAPYGETLSPFLYKKPVIGVGGVFAPEEVWEEKLREGCYPLGFVQNAYRGPHHWHRKDDALFCAVLVDGAWQTRYFPKQNIPESTWEEACSILGVKSKMQIA